jgi:hypothetical protein
LGAGAVFGFDSLGSFPSFKASTIRIAFHFAYLIFDCVSASGGVHILTSSRRSPRLGKCLLFLCCVLETVRDSDLEIPTS